VSGTGSSAGEPPAATLSLLRELRIAPSILSANFARLGEQVAEVLDAGARVIHVDVMDGHFVPPITFGPIIVEALAEQVHAAGAVIDVHLMIERPERQIADIARAASPEPAPTASRFTSRRPRTCITRWPQSATRVAAPAPPCVRRRRSAR